MMRWFTKDELCKLSVDAFDAARARGLPEGEAVIEALKALDEARAKNQATLMASLNKKDEVAS